MRCIIDIVQATTRPGSNAKAVTHLSLAVLPGFVKRDRGTLINIGSVLSFFALPISTSYSATKAT
jgi:short-subunit dehydrogenase